MIKTGATVESESGTVHIVHLTHPRYMDHSYRFMKRVFDILVSGISLVLMFPLFVAVAIAIMITDGCPFVYKQERVGRNGRPFMMYKFRTMHRNAEQILQSNPALLAEYQKNFKLENDPRLLPCGKRLREFSMDELPQLINVLLGDMSIVGPRPLLERETKRYGDSIAVYHSMKPGCAGLWQHRGRNSLTFEDRIVMDVEYFNTASIRSDLVVVWETAKAVVQRKGVI